MNTKISSFIPKLNFKSSKIINSNQYYFPLILLIIFLIFPSIFLMYLNMHMAITRDTEWWVSDRARLISEPLFRTFHKKKWLIFEHSEIITMFSKSQLHLYIHPSGINRILMFGFSPCLRVFQHVVIQIFLYEGSMIFERLLASRLGQSPINNLSLTCF